jgi:hypothetical protein
MMTKMAEGDVFEEVNQDHKKTQMSKSLPAPRLRQAGK